MDARPHQRYPSQNGADSTHIARRSISGFGSPVANGAMPIFNGQNPMPVPPQAGMNGNGFSGHRQRQSTLGGPMPFDHSRSPPNSKNTAHVPCKFFRQGNCQAGPACPFSHELGTINDPIPCKYFAKGNCKFGAKCANPHIMADGRDGRMIQQWQGQYGPGPRGFNNRNRAPSSPFPNPSGTNGFISAAPLSPEMGYSNISMDDYYGPSAQARHLEGLGGGGDADLPSIAFPKHGSPSADLALSPPVRAMDAQLPPSFDNHNISHIARFGPAAASVPSTFGLLKTPISPALSNATPSAFINRNYLTASNLNGFPISAQLPSSLSTNGGDPFPRKILHSEIRSHPQTISMSVPGQPLFPHTGTDHDTEGSEEEINCIPHALDDLLHPAERRRRFSRPDDDSTGLSGRLTMSNFVGSPSDSKVGSPTNASPSSRYGALFQRRQAEQNNSDILGTSSSSGFGHVGSPLRKSSLQHGPGNGTPPSFGASPGAGAARGNGQLSMLSQQFRGLGVSSKNSGEVGQGTNSSSSYASSPQAAGEAALPSGRGGIGGSTLTPGLSAVGAPGARATADRSISSSSMKNTTQERIEEEFLFSMDDPEEAKRKEERRSQEVASSENAPLPKRTPNGAGPGGMSARAWNMVASKAAPAVALPVPASAGAQQRGGAGSAAAARIPPRNIAPR